jgi:hypothetical protein
VFGRTVLVLVAMQGECGTAHAPQVIVETPIGKRRGKPRLDPRIEDPPRLRAVVSGKALELPWSREFRASGLKTRTSAILYEALRRLGHDGGAAIGPPRRRRNRHPATDAVTERDDDVDA